MPMNRTRVIVLTLAIVAAAAGLAFRQATTTAPAAAPTTAIPAADSPAARLLALELPDGSGTRQSLGQWKGQVLVVNFWATWCAPCRKEIPEFAAASDKYRERKVQFVGISIDSAEKVADFKAKMKVPYPLLIASPQVIALTEDLGNASQGLPFTVIYDRHGAIALVKLGVLSASELESTLAALSAS